MFRQCLSVTKIEKIKVNSIKTSAMANMFVSANSLEEIEIEGTIKVDSNDLNLMSCSKLTVASMLSILNALEDNTGGTQYTVHFGSTNLAKLTDEQQTIATNKNIKLV
jgi:hypothetical protein